MLKQLLDILVCPFDKESSLELFELKTRKFEANNDVVIDENDKGERGLKDSPSNIKDQYNKDIVIEEGVLFCNDCSRFYPIVQEIPIILPDELRDKDKDMEILNKWSNSLPDKIIKKGFPWHL